MFNIYNHKRTAVCKFCFGISLVSLLEQDWELHCIHFMLEHNLNIAGSFL